MQAGVEALDLPINGSHIVDGRWQNDAQAAQLDQRAAIIFGSPTYNANGFYFGAGATASSPDQLTEIDLATGTHLGARVAELALGKS